MANSYTDKRAAGKFGEIALAKVLERAGATVVFNNSKDKQTLKEYDLTVSIGQTIFTAEAKFDQMEATTGNIAVEYYNTKKGEPSGIDATKADIWAFILQRPQSVWVCRTADLKSYKDTVRPFKDIACGGDDNAAIKVYRREEIFAAVPFHRIDTVTPTHLTSLLITLTKKENEDER